MGQDHTPNGTSECPLESALLVIGGKWKTILLSHLMGGTMRFGELKKNTVGITQRMLTRQLRELESDGLISRMVYRQAPPKVEYSLTPLGASLRPIVDALASWGEEHSPRYSGPPGGPCKNP